MSVFSDDEVQILFEYSAEEASKSGVSAEEWILGFVYKSFVFDTMEGINAEYPELIKQASRLSYQETEKVLHKYDESVNRYDIEYPIYISLLLQVLPDSKLRDNLVFVEKHLN